MSISLGFGLLLVGHCESGLPLRRETLRGRLVAPTSPTPAAGGKWESPRLQLARGGGNEALRLPPAQPRVASGLGHLGHVATGQ